MVDSTDSALLFLSACLIWNEYNVLDNPWTLRDLIQNSWFTSSEHLNENKLNTDKVIMHFFVDPYFLFRFALLKRLKPGHLGEQ